MVYFIYGFVVGILLSLISYIALNLLQNIPAPTTYYDINDKFHDIDVMLQKI